MRSKTVSVIVNYQHGDDTLRCVAALRRSTHLDHHIVVVDNGSSPESVALLEAGLDAVPLIKTGENLGFAGGTNRGVEHALALGADFVWLVNPDIAVDAEALTALLRVMEAHPDAGIVGCTVAYGASVPPRVWFGGGVIDWERGGAASHRDDGRPLRDVETGIVRPTDYITGACMLVRRQVFEEIGLLPEHYFLYFEETDFNVRAARAGWRVLIDTTPLATHYKRSTSALPAPYYVYYYIRGRILFGRAFTDLPAEAHAADLRPWIGAWRKKVSERAPTWLVTYDRLVETALADGAAGRTGPRPDIHQIPQPKAAA